MKRSELLAVLHDEPLTWPKPLFPRQQNSGLLCAQQTPQARGYGIGDEQAEILVEANQVAVE